MQSYTQFYRAIHSYTGLFTAIKRGTSLKKLWCCFGGVTSFNKLVLYRAIYSYAGLYTAIQIRVV